MDCKIGEGGIGEKWRNYKGEEKVVKGGKKGGVEMMVVGRGVGGGCGGGCLGEMGLGVLKLCMEECGGGGECMGGEGGMKGGKK